jgi:tRNA U34 5-carboxymethylaminomethyl modifying GTPase MnmE/TrmE
MSDATLAALSDLKNLILTVLAKRNETITVLRSQVKALSEEKVTLAGQVVADSETINALKVAAEETKAAYDADEAKESEVELFLVNSINEFSDSIGAIAEDNPGVV